MVITAKHHDGFCLWEAPSAVGPGGGKDWHSVARGPRRDLLEEFCEAMRAEDLCVGFYYSLLEWYNPLYRADTKGRKRGARLPPRRQYAEQVVNAQLRDLVLRYRPEVIWADGHWQEEAVYCGAPGWSASGKPAPPLACPGATTAS